MASSSDRTLLDRLNALKPSTVKLEQSENALDISTSDISQHKEPPSREDALSARLKLLRSQSGDTGSAQEPITSRGQDSEHLPAQGSRDVERPITTTTSVKEWEKDFDESILEDDAALFDYHASLEEDADVHEKESEDVRVAKLLASIAKDMPKDNAWRDTKVHNGDSDDSDGEVMFKEVKSVLERALDEAELAARDDHDDDKRPQGDNRGREADDGRPKAALDASGPTSPNPTNKKGDDADPLAPPSAPTDLPSPPADINPDNEPTLDFESSIAARMAALKLPKANAPSADDPLGLPSAPRFAPEDRPVAGLVAKKSAYTDEDQKTWCVICYEDATIRCEGCDDDVYCARCWREGHVGPDAQYDTRGHRWETFRRYAR